MRIAALDLGSNSFHLLVADVHPDGSFEAVSREKDMLRLGDDVARHGLISPSLADRAVASVRRFRQLADALGAQEVLAKATSAIRTASNGSELVDRIEAETGVEVEVISGLEEARLIFAAVRASLVLEPAPALCVDIGGGSVEFAVGDAAGLRWATSVPLGVGRLTAELVVSDPPSRTDRDALETRIADALAPIVDEVRSRKPQMAVGTSGTINDLARLAAASDDGEIPASANGLRMHVDQLHALQRRIVKMSTAERRRLPGIEDKRADLLPAGVTLLATIFDVFEIAVMVTSDWALREGIVLDAVRIHDPDDWSDDPRALRRAAVAGLARRCGSDSEHSQHVAALALSLFDQTQVLHQLGDADREMLEDAALLHDIGQHVSRKGHHRHAAYLVDHAQLRGFAPDEVQFVAALVRHHRRGDIKASEPRAAALDKTSRDRLRKLAALLRLADGLDRGRRGVVEGVDVNIGADLVVLRLHARDNAELELWGVRRRRDLFEKVFERELEATVTRGAAQRTAVLDV
ncbi:MAG TPA: Ppx/GppA phosphatase family protein [Acidimicrobiia bacterium]|jgi:exopolyphosphatase/guanosine-5'-triphosphate,3'-diphosphate pyrophosphatase|nr:Ppx/GppA phosphatase family protein [Acidimicrobiia bacterium]